MLDRNIFIKIQEKLSLFKKACPHFDELQETVGLAIRKHLKNSIKETIDTVEIGCGTGNTSKVLLKCDKRTQIVAVDVDNIALDYSKHTLNYYIKKKRIKFLKKDALKFLKSCKDSSFDVFASVFTLHNLDEEYRNEVLSHIYRILRNGGLFVNTDKYANDNKILHERDLKWQLEQFKRIYDEENRLDLREKWTKHYLEDNRESKIMPGKEALSKMKDLGFRDISFVYRKRLESSLIAKK